MFSECKGVRGGVALLSGLSWWVGSVAPAFADGTTRGLPDRYVAGEAFTVSITIDFPDGAVSVTLEDSPPDGWTEITNISGGHPIFGGSYDAVHHKVKWWPFGPGDSHEVAYDVTAPGGAVGEQCFDGAAFFDGPDQPIGGDQCVPENGCPADATISAAAPPDGTVDARQAHEPTAVLPRQGVGSSNEVIVIVLDPPESGAEGCFELCETAQDSLLGANSIAGVTHTGDGTYEILLDHVITAGAVTTIEHTGDGSYVAYVAHPANVNADGVSSADDVLALIDILDGGASPPWGTYSTDADHSGMATAADIVRVIDLLNGAGQYDPWLGTQLPGNTSCP